MPMWGPISSYYVGPGARKSWGVVRMRSADAVGGDTRSGSTPWKGSRSIRVSLDAWREQRTFCSLWRPDDTADSLLPLHDEHLVTRLQTTEGIEAEGPEERRAGELMGRGKLGGIVTTPTVSQAARAQEPGGKGLGRGIWGLPSCHPPIPCHEPLGAGAFIRGWRRRRDPLRRPEQPFPLVPQRSEHLLNTRSHEGRRTPGAPQHKGSRRPFISKAAHHEHHIGPRDK
jgi:hypothetical protein